ncbi:MAG: hypothetical protein WBZ24_00710 [Anaerolineales bacterium]
MSQRTHGPVVFILSVLMAASLACNALTRVPPLAGLGNGNHLSDASLIADWMPKAPPLSSLQPDAHLVKAGQEVTFRGDPLLTGDLQLQGPSGTIITGQFTGGKGSATLPSDAADGIYLASVTSSDGALAVGEIRVVSKPALWLESDPPGQGSPSGTMLHVYALDVPTSFTAAVSVGVQVTPDQMAAAMQSNKPIDLPSTMPSEFVPDESGNLTPASTGRVPVQQLLGKALKLPAAATGPARIVADTPGAESNGTGPSDQAVQSNEINVGGCDTAGEIDGDLGAEGVVSAVTLGPPVEQHSASTQGGSFSLAVPAGPALVMGLVGQGISVQELEPVAVAVPCGGKVKANLGSASPASNSGLRPPAVPIRWSPAKAPNAVALVPAPHRTQAGSGSGPSACTNIFVMNFKASDKSIPSKVPPTFASWTTAQLWKALPRATVTSMSDIRSLLTLGSMQQLLGGSGGTQVNLAEIGGALGADVLVTGTMGKTGGSYSLFLSALDVKNASVITRKSLTSGTIEGLLDGIPGFVQSLTQAGLCLSVSPTTKRLSPKAKASLTVKTSDLAGKPYASQVTLNVPEPGCGQLDWTHQTMTGDSVEDTYTAGSEDRCMDKLDFTAQASFDGATVHARPASSRIEVNTGWNLTVTTTLGQDPNTFKLKWVGNFIVDKKGTISGVGVGSVDGNLPDYPCIVFDFDKGQVRQEKNPATAKGNFSFLIQGTETGSGSGDEFNLKLAGFSTKLTYHFSNKTCSANASYDIFTGPFVQILAEHPDLALQNSGGPIKVPAKAGASTEVPYTLGQPSTLKVSVTQATSTGDGKP